METTSPINKDTLESQNKRLLNFLQQGNSIHVFSQAKKRLKIGYLNSRISDLKKAGYKVASEFITVTNSEGAEVRVKKYFLTSAFPEKAVN